MYAIVAEDMNDAFKTAVHCHDLIGMRGSGCYADELGCGPNDQLQEVGTPGIA